MALSYHTMGKTGKPGDQGENHIILLSSIHKSDKMMEQLHFEGFLVLVFFISRTVKTLLRMHSPILQNVNLSTSPAPDSSIPAELYPRSQAGNDRLRGVGPCHAYGSLGFSLMQPRLLQEFRV